MPDVMRRAIGIWVLALAALTSSGCGPCLPGTPCPIAALAVGGRGGGSAPPGEDRVGPRIQILSPARGVMLDGDPQVRIFAIVTDASQVLTLTVDDEPVAFESDGKFTVDRVLRFGVNRFKAVATDGAGNQSVAEWAYVWSPTFRPPAVLLPNAVTARIRRGVFSVLPRSLTDALAGKGVTRTDVFGDFPFTVTVRPATLTQGPDAITAVAAASAVAASGTPIAQQDRGFPSRDPGVAIGPKFELSRDLAIAVREDVVNQALYTAFARGNWNVRIDQALLKARGIALPFAFDARLLAGYFPELAPFAQAQAPLTIDLVAALPPVLDSRGQTSHPRISFGEMRVVVSVTAGQKPQPVLSLAAHYDTDAVIGDAQCPSIQPSRPRRLSLSVLENPLGLSQPGIDAFLSAAGDAVALVADALPAIQVPLIDCFTLGKVRLQTVAGAGTDFLVVYGEIVR